MPIRDRAIAWKTKREFIHVQKMTGFFETAGVLTSLGAGTPLLVEALAAAQISGMAVNAAGNEIFHFWPIPRDMDRAHPIRVRYLFIKNSTDADTPGFKTFYKGWAPGEVLSAANSTEDELLTHAAHTCGVVANVLEATVWHKSASNTKISAADIALLFCFECDSLGSASANEIILVGVEIEYTIGATAASREITTEALPSAASF
jgi:hypothetical protein